MPLILVANSRSGGMEVWRSVEGLEYLASCCCCRLCSVMSRACTAWALAGMWSSPRLDCYCRLVLGPGYCWVC